MSESDSVEPSEPRGRGSRLGDLEFEGLEGLGVW